MADEVVRSEDVLSEKWAKCFADTMIKTASGATLGAVISLTNFGKTKGGFRWPILLFTGIGLGMGMANCNNEFKYPHLVKLRKVSATETS